MKFRHKSQYEWHKYFCWVPVTLRDRETGVFTTFWLEYVERKVEGLPSTYGDVYYVYREIK